jgi:hypothetical protein
VLWVSSGFFRWIGLGFAHRISRILCIFLLVDLLISVSLCSRISFYAFARVRMANFAPCRSNPIGTLIFSSSGRSPLSSLGGRFLRSPGYHCVLWFTRFQLHGSVLSSAFGCQRINGPHKVGSRCSRVGLLLNRLVSLRLSICHFLFAPLFAGWLLSSFPWVPSSVFRAVVTCAVLLSTVSWELEGMSLDVLMLILGLLPL